MTYEIEGSFTVSVMIEVCADDEKSAILLAKNVLNERYNLDKLGSYHNVNEGAEFDLDAFDPDDY